MIFKSISFYQYRCFMNGEAEFCESEDHQKSITLFVAPNGSGKTELLFSFWWVLYGFDFSTLLNKEETPYALNTENYRKLQNGPIGNRDWCSVKLEFESDGIRYVVSKKETYEKLSSRRQLRVTSEIEFSNIDENGVSSPPNRNKDEIERELDKIIPRRILNGIIFDGERMQRISSTNEKSIESIQGVINDVTNKDFIEFCLNCFIEASRDYNNELRRIAKNGGNNRLVDITNQLDKLGKDIINNTKIKETLTQKEHELEGRLSFTKDSLKSYQETKALAIKLESKISEKNNTIKMLNDKIEDLFGELNKYGYTLALDKLIDRVEVMIKSYNIPTGLTVSVVDSILNQEKCICGTEFNEKMIENLHALQKLLPPDNLNAVLKEEIISLTSKNKDTRNNLQKIWRDIKNAEKVIKECQEDIAHISSSIGEISEEGQRLEEERSKLERELGGISSTLRTLPLKIQKAENEQSYLAAEKKKISKSMGIASSLSRKSEFIDKCVRALSKLQERFRQYALTEINSYLQDAYKEVAEDYEDGRQVYITQYLGKSYKIINYYTKKVEEYIKNADWFNIAQQYSLKPAELTDEIKQEIAIIENAVSKSTGQGKSVTIAFVKAILDYSSIDKIDEEFQFKKDYPLVIDAPFSELSGENLVRPAQSLNTFSKQVILFLAPSNYESVREHIEPHVGMKYIINKAKDTNRSSILREA